MVCFALYLLAQVDTATVLKIFRFPSNQIPRIDGDFHDWDIIPDSYTVGIDKMHEDEGKYNAPNKATLDIKVKVGWVEGLNRLYFLYEANDNYWDFSRSDLTTDILELIVDGDASGGPFINRFHPNKQLDKWTKFNDYHGVHAQNYHIFTPAEGKDWCMVWGCQPWIKELPYANAAYSYNFKQGEAGKLFLEFYITPFDYAGSEGKQRAIESFFYENKLIGLSWAVIDYDGNEKSKDGFWNLSPYHTMYGNASQLVMFRLMPFEPQFVSHPKADWSFDIIDYSRRLVAFHDKSFGNIKKWKWDFGDNEQSMEQHPIHKYKQGGQYIVTLYINSSQGKSKLTKVWDVTLP